MNICLFWYGSRLRQIDRVCVSSMLAVGHEVHLYSYDPVENVQPGVILKDAAEIMPRAALAPVQANQWTIAQFSDVFRVMLMKHRRGAWLDTDTYLAKPFRPDPARHYLAWENDHRVGVSALYFPPDSPIIGEFEQFLTSGDVLPKWLGFRRRLLRPLLYRILGREIFPRTCGLTVFGNDGISRLARKYGIMSQAAPKQSFYFWNGKLSKRVYDPAFKLETTHPDFIGFHFAWKYPEADARPRPGSFYAIACQSLI